ncbi:hypothetical protein CYY_006436 [Polysphondylium violaceum]|uniref:Ubiquitin carboxyl-terminal hydrolase n=1 Tax=Polysphondylium violaceum TaxID=133409 RepID=A0A8J4PZW9_9MYCE|nr:hypothetical protein CYY_006436 [Polysphondylium violaceum]
MEDDGWCTIESDPGVFTELITKIGVKDIQVEELYSLESFEYERLKPILGLIFLFKWVDDKEPKQISENTDIFFANQVINNACATQAILSILLNNKDIDIGEELSNFKSFVQEFPPPMKGEAIGNSDLIRETHNSFAIPQPFIFSKDKSKSSSDAFHFISFIPFDGKVYELDGLKQGPICLGEYTDIDNWLDVVTGVIQSRMEKYSEKEIRFNLMAVIKNRTSTLKSKISDLEKRLELVDTKFNRHDSMDTDDSDGLPTNKADLQVIKGDIEMEIDNLNNEIVLEKEKFKVWREENIRRKHNFMPFLLNLIKSLAEKDKLQPMIDAAKASAASKSSSSK